MDRKKVLKIFTGFLTVMFLFTVLSRAVSGASMARVETVTVSSGSIDHKITASGKVEAGKEIAVYTQSGQRVKEICVKEGQSVEAGQVLFRVDSEELEESILAARQELEKTKLQNEDAQEARDSQINSQERARNRAAEDYHEAVSSGDAQVAEAKQAWDEAESKLQKFLNEGPGNGKDSLEDVEGGSGREEELPGEGRTDGAKETMQTKENAGSKEENVASEEESAGGQPAGNSDLKADWESQKADLEQAAAEAKAAYDLAVSSRLQNIKAATRAMEDASSQEPLDSSVKQNEITRKQQELALNKLLELEQAQGEVTAPASGTVTQIIVTTGDFTPEGTAVRMADTSEGCRLVASIDKSSEKYVSTGSPVNIKAFGSKELISDYTVSSITENQEDPSLLDVAVDLPQGVLEVGTMADVEIVNESENYGAIIPLQALHEEQNGYFILLLEQEQGVMGKELVVKRLEVQVLEKNAANAALEEGLLSADQEIVSSSSRSIEEGSKVRRKGG